MLPPSDCAVGRCVLCPCTAQWGFLAGSASATGLPLVLQEEGSRSKGLRWGWASLPTLWGLPQAASQHLGFLPGRNSVSGSGPDPSWLNLPFHTGTDPATPAAFAWLLDSPRVASGAGSKLVSSQLATSEQKGSCAGPAALWAPGPQGTLTGKTRGAPAPTCTERAPRHPLRGTGGRAEKRSGLRFSKGGGGGEAGWPVSVFMLVAPTQELPACTFAFGPKAHFSIS